MPRADYRCNVCGWVVEAEVESRPFRCKMPEGTSNDDRLCSGTMMRVWGRVHLGSMSSGEPPR